MKRKYILSLFCLLSVGLFAQNIEQAKVLLDKGEYEKAKPIFLKQVKSQPNNGLYNLWYGICCLNTNAAEEAIPYFEKAIKRRTTGGELYLAQAYHATYRFEDAIGCYEDYIAALSKRKKPTEDAEKLLEKSRSDLRMLKGVEDVCIIDSFVVDKKDLLSTYKISEESGKLFTYNDYFQNTDRTHPGTVYETEIGSKVYYSDKGRKNFNIYTQTKLLDEWSKGKELPESINTSGNTNYPFVMTDGVTIYYATDGEGLGGYDIYVTRYNTNTDTYLNPENVGMPFNSPFNDYMYVIDEYNNLGWFASDRYQPEGKVCVYVFIPNSSKQVYNYESMELSKLIRLAQIHSLKETWKDPKEVAQAKARLEEVQKDKPKKMNQKEFEFIIDDRQTYTQQEDFQSPKALQLFLQYQQLDKDLQQQEVRLEGQRNAYSQSNKADKSKLAPAILDLEQRVLQMSKELTTLAKKIRDAEKSKLK